MVFSQNWISGDAENNQILYNTEMKKNDCLNQKTFFSKN